MDPSKRSRPGGETGAASFAGDNHSVATATVLTADYNSDTAWILTARCPFCGAVHRHAWQASDPDLAVVQRDASCGRGRYVLVGLERVIA